VAHSGETVFSRTANGLQRMRMPPLGRLTSVFVSLKMLAFVKVQAMADGLSAILSNSDCVVMPGHSAAMQERQANKKDEDAALIC